MEKITITKIYRNETDKQGNRFISKKTGQPYTKLTLLTKEYPKNYLYGFENTVNFSWQVGQQVEVEIEKGEKFWNFRMPPKNISRKDVEEMLKEEREYFTKLLGEFDERIAILEAKAGINKMEQPEESEEVPEPENLEI